ncbi:uncharacterized protein EAF02_003327 [Botrytis sinoallii]|uniref:uncharacterized protein n=1 Tax=Botrytis sinoallii TaxID=1463999 RepID=UPI0019010855|nr:uncharacterized protein EAF02_003327 [Botrytis sinoallii]KAF7886680.1 hypothetical protein EAF02_003327 [Botrytis sinoallii]
MAFLQPGFCHYGPSTRAVELCIPSFCVADEKVWRPEFVSDYFSTRRLAVTRYINWLINDVAARARLEHAEEASLLEAPTQVIKWSDPVPIEEWIRATASVRPAGRAVSRHSVSSRGGVTGILRPGLRQAIFSKSCQSVVPVVFSSLEDASVASAEGQSGRCSGEPPFSNAPDPKSLVRRGLLFFPELDVRYMWGDEYKRAKARFLLEVYGIDLLCV